MSHTYSIHNECGRLLLLFLSGEVVSQGASFRVNEHQMLQMKHQMCVFFNHLQGGCEHDISIHILPLKKTY